MSHPLYKECKSMSSHRERYAIATEIFYQYPDEDHTLNNQRAEKLHLDKPQQRKNFVLGRFVYLGFGFAANPFWICIKWCNGNLMRLNAHICLGETHSALRKELLYSCDGIELWRWTWHFLSCMLLPWDHQGPRLGEYRERTIHLNLAVLEVLWWKSTAFISSNTGCQALYA